MRPFARVAQASARKPPKVIEVPPDVFADSFNRKPLEAVRVGVKHISCADAQVARAEAAMTAWKVHPKREDEEGRIECFNDTLVRWVVARGTCSPDDVTKPCSLWPALADDIVMEALTPRGARFIFDEIDLMSRELSPVRDEADDDDVEMVQDCLGPALEVMSPATRQACLRMLIPIIEAIESVQDQLL